MAKKSFNVKSTLKKTKPVQPELATKIPLQTKRVDAKKLKEKVEKIHKEETKPKQTKQKKIKQEEKIIRLTIDTPVKIHTALKIKAITQGVSMRDLVLSLIEKEIS